jgi:His-Xaa-Ser system radical SAM maturase HxsB
MSEEDADKSIALALSSPNQTIKIEFQGGEPFLNFELMQHVVSRSLEWNAQLPRPKSISFVAATNLAVVTDDMLEFCRAYDISISTSLDGPEGLHNKNRPRPGADSYARAISGMHRARQILGRDRVSALMTTTVSSLSLVRDIVDEYMRQDLPGIFLRPLSPYGFAVKTKAIRAYNASQWLKFYDEGLDYIIDVNRHGIDFREYYASTIVTKIFKDEDPGYVDLTSPAGVGTGAVVYNYDGFVYASDEARMLAEMGDETFKLGSVSDSFEKIFTNEILLTALDQSFAYSSPICNDCAFEPWCGADPVFHWGQQHDFCGKKWDSEFCSRNMHIFRSLVNRMESDPFVKKLFRKWAR